MNLFDGLLEFLINKIDFNRINRAHEQQLLAPKFFSKNERKIVHRKAYINKN